MQDTWIRAADQTPPDGQLVLAVKELRNGTRDICLARCIHNYRYMDIETKQFMTTTYWCCGGNNNIIYWMQLPEIPQKGGST